MWLFSQGLIAMRLLPDFASQHFSYMQISPTSAIACLRGRRHKYYILQVFSWSFE